MTSEIFLKLNTKIWSFHPNPLSPLFHIKKSHGFPLLFKDLFAPYFPYFQLTLTLSLQTDSYCTPQNTLVKHPQVYHHIVDHVPAML